MTTPPRPVRVRLKRATPKSVRKQRAAVESGEMHVPESNSNAASASPLAAGRIVRVRLRRAARAASPSSSSLSSPSKSDGVPSESTSDSPPLSGSDRPLLYPSLPPDFVSPPLCLWSTRHDARAVRIKRQRNDSAACEVVSECEALSPVCSYRFHPLCQTRLIAVYGCHRTSAAGKPLVLTLHETRRQQRRMESQN